MYVDEIIAKIRAATGHTDLIDTFDPMIARQNAFRDKRGKHDYSLQEFGLTTAATRSHFRNYCERFGMPFKDTAA